MPPCAGKPLIKGPRGGTYCIGNTGKKIYVRRGTPVAQPVAKQLAVAKPVAKPVAQPVAQPVAKPAVKPVAKPQRRKAAKPAATPPPVVKPQHKQKQKQEEQHQSTESAPFVSAMSTQPWHASLDLKHAAQSFEKHGREASVSHEQIFAKLDFFADQKKFGGLPKLLKFPSKRKLSPAEFERLFKSNVWQTNVFTDAVVKLLTTKHACALPGLAASVTLEQKWRTPQVEIGQGGGIDQLRGLVNKCNSRAIALSLHVRNDMFFAGHTNILVIDKAEGTVRVVEPGGRGTPGTDDSFWPAAGPQTALFKFVKEHFREENGMWDDVAFLLGRERLDRASRIARLAVLFAVREAVAKPLGFEMEMAPSCPIQGKHHWGLAALAGMDDMQFLTQGGLCNIWSVMNIVIASRLPLSDFDSAQWLLKKYAHANNSNMAFLAAAFTKNALEAIDKSDFDELNGMVGMFDLPFPMA